MLIDSHCHLDQLDLAQYNGDLELALKAANENGVERFLCVCIDMNNFPAVLKIAEQYPHIYASVGLHPNEQNTPEPSVEELVNYAAHPKVVAIGETGLDSFRSGGDLTWQQDRFRRHIQAAKQSDKPLIVHMRNSGEETLAILKEEDVRDVGAVLHCFTDTLDIAMRALDLGLYISFSGIITFKNAKDLREIATKVPLDRLLIETDSPYLAPDPFRGKPNQPAYVLYVAECIAALKGLTLSEVAAATSDNFYQLFKSAAQ